MSPAAKPARPDIRTLGLFGNPAKSELPTAAARIARMCSAAGVGVLASEEMAGIVPADLPVVPHDELVARADLIIAVGGDGTMLRAGRVLGASGVPLLGVNLGSLGYLTDIPLEELDEAVRQVLAGNFHIDARSRVACRVLRDGREVATTNALNDLVVNMGPLPRALGMELIMDGDSLGRFLGDGIIVSTPTGSTAYNLSAGGPICQATVRCLLVAPICPHSLGMRPLIVDESTRIELIIHETGDGGVLTADGQKSTVLEDGDRLVFAVSDSQVNLVKFPQSSFYRVMRHKLNWGGPYRRFRRGE